MATRTTPSIRDAVDQYLETRATEIAAQSYIGERTLLARFVAYCPDKQVGRLTRDDLEGFVRALKRGDAKAGCRKPNGNGAVSLAMGRVRGFLAWSSRKGWCGGDLMDGAKPPKRGPRRDFLRLPAGELLQMLEDAKHPRDRGILAMGMNTGLRSSELTGLPLGAIDLERSEFFVYITKTQVTDYMPITLDLDGELRRWLAYYQSQCGPLQSHWFAFPAKGPDRFVSRGHTTSGQLRPSVKFAHAHRVVQRSLLDLGYTEQQTEHEGFHTLRRSVARLYFDSLTAQGYDSALRQTSALLHHSSTLTTEIYLGLDMERAQRDVKLKGMPFLTAMVPQVANLRDISNG